MTDTITPAAAPARGRGRAARPGAVLLLVLMGQFMALLDVSVVNIAAPSVRTDLDAGGSELQLVISGYTIAYALLLVTCARLGERLGFDRMFRAGLTLFTLASLACGLAPTAEALVGLRLLQGVGAAVMVPQVMSIIQRTFTGAARVRAIGVYTAVVSGGMVAGQILGGVLVTADVLGTGWRPIFLINVPIGAVLLVLSFRLLPRYERVHRALDVPGLLLLTAAVGFVVSPLVLGHELGWPSWCWAMLAAGAASFAAFVAVERRIGARGGSPLIRGRVLRAPGLAPSAVAVSLVMAGVSGFMIAYTLHLQGALGRTPLQVGLIFAPMAAGFGLAGLYWRRLPAVLHPRLAGPALLLGAAGYVLLGRAIGTGDGISWPVEVLLCALGVLSGCAYGRLFSGALAGVEPRDAADASGVLVTLVQLGQVAGVATIGSLFLAAAGPAAADSADAAALATFAVAGVNAAAGLVAIARRGAESAH